MSRISVPLGILTVSLITLMGCAQKDSGQTALEKRVKSLEAKCIRLEGDFRAAVADRDEYRTDLQAAQRQRDGLRKEVAQLQERIASSDEELAALNRELADARAANEQRQRERDDALARAEATQEQFDSFRQMLRIQIEQAEAAFNYTPDRVMPVAGL